MAARRAAKYGLVGAARCPSRDATDLGAVSTMAMTSASARWSGATSVSAMEASPSDREPAYQRTNPPGMERVPEPEPDRRAQTPSRRSEASRPSTAAVATVSAANPEADDAI